ncbi:MAG TPA: SCO family protein [Candidatus Acidoferrales bacterium]|nr:SCO family protein [Candidatus Acidoferrales bacterium]
MNRRAQSPCTRRCWVARSGLALLALLYFAPTTAGQTLLPPDPSRTVGNLIRFDGFVDENGRELSASLPELERDPRPWIISPMYTRCPGTCPAITANLRRALEQSGLTPSEYRVLSFSFDPNETADGLRAFRARLQLPPAWLTLRAGDPQALERTLQALDFRSITIGNGDFEHPNLVAVLAPDMRLAGYLFGITFSPSKLALLVRSARAGVSAVDAWRPYMFLFAALGFLASALVFGILLSRKRARTRRSSMLSETV